MTSHSGSQPDYMLELLHIADQEAAAQSVFDAPRLSAVMNALEAQDLGDDGLEDNTIRLSSGDAILPGLFFAASETIYGAPGVADILIQNALGLQAVALGNHEFDRGPEFLADLIDGSLSGGLVGADGNDLDPTVDGFPGTAFPYLSANLDFSTQPDLAALAVPGAQSPQPNAVTSSIVLEEGGELIGVIGATTPTLPTISTTGALQVNPAAFDSPPTDAQVEALAAIIQAEVDALLASHAGLDKIVLLAHMQQLQIEQRLAEKLSGVDIIVAGGSNSILADDTDRLRDGDAAVAAYPIEATDADGNTTLVVNTDGSYTYVGRLVVGFDEQGRVIPGSVDPDVSGAYATDLEGVQALDAESLIDPEIQDVADRVGAMIRDQESNVFGVTEVYLDGRRASVRSEETNLGNLTADANLAAAKVADPTVVVSIKNGGGIRDDIGEVTVPPGGTEPEFLPPEGVTAEDGEVIKPDGGISQTDIVNTLRFNNGLTLLTLTNAELAAVIEHAVAASEYDVEGPVNTQGRFPQIAGLAFSFDPSRPSGDRIEDMAILDEAGEVFAPVVRDGEVVNPEETHRVVTLNFMAEGGDGYPFPKEGADRVDLFRPDDAARTGDATFAADGTEQDALAEYLDDTFRGADGIAAFSDEEDPIAEDARIQNLAFRESDVLAALPLRLNEVLGSTTGADVEFIELSGEPGASLAGLSLIVVESDDERGPGAIDRRFDFGADAEIGANGRFLVGNAAVASAFGVTPDASIPDNFIENSAYTLALVETPSLAGGVVTGGETVLDAVGVADPGGDNTFFFDAPVVGPDGTFLPAGAVRDPEADGAFRALDAFFFPGEATPTPGAEDDGGAALATIAEVQGAGDESPLEGETVAVRGVVTLINGQFRNEGVFLQSLEGDGDAATSEGLFVFTDSAPAVSVGDVVEVAGVVDERFGLTSIIPAEVTDTGEDAALPEAVEVALPLADATDPGAFYETLEGMRVRFVAGEGSDLTVTDTFTRFGEVGVTAGDPLRQPTQLFESFTPEAEALAESNARNFILFEDRLDRFAEAPRVGDGVEGDAVEGVLNFSFGEFKVETQDPVDFDQDEGAARPEAPPEVGGRLKVATFNVLNYFVTLGERGAETAEELEIQTSKLVAALAALDADVVGLVEIENDAGAATQALVDALNAEIGAGTYAFIDTGMVGTDAIKQALIYKPETVTPLGEFAVLDAAAFVDPLGAGRDLNRPAIAQTFEENATGEAFTAAVNHFKSKGSETGVVVDGEPDDSPVEGSAALTRVAAAEALADWLETMPTGVDDQDTLILGDINAYAQERAILALEDEGFTNLVAEFQSLDAVSYQFDGRLGTLDYAFGNRAILDEVTGAAIWNINSPEAYGLQYDGALFDAFGDPDSPFASSDHDPVLVGLDLAPERPVLVAEGSGPLTGSEAAEIFILGGGAANIVETGEGADTLRFLPALEDDLRTRFIVQDFETGVDEVDFAAEAVAFSRMAGPNLFVAFDNAARDTALFQGVEDLDALFGPLVA
jgi:predicted extracellular nuclease/2',3'-cyclic-nucleotide 2'-phosphodiesterase (5'-nucleotidase family)